MRQPTAPAAARTTPVQLAWPRGHRPEPLSTRKGNVLSMLRDAHPDRVADGTELVAGSRHDRPAIKERQLMTITVRCLFRPGIKARSRSAEGMRPLKAENLYALGEKKNRYRNRPSLPEKTAAGTFRNIAEVSLRSWMYRRLTIFALFLYPVRDCLYFPRLFQRQRRCSRYIDNRKEQCRRR
jgi:hypothetical protein